MYFRLLKCGAALSALLLALAVSTPTAPAGEIVTTVIDTFSEATPSGMGGSLVPGIFVNDPGAGGPASAMAVDMVGDGFDPIGGSRTVMLMHTDGGITQAFTDTGFGEFSASSNAGSSAVTMLSYSPPTVEPDGSMIVLASDTIDVIFSFTDTGEGVTVPLSLELNGMDVGTILVPDDFIGAISFDVSAFVGQQISSIKFTLTGNEATDVTITQIDGTFERVPPPPPPPGVPIPEPASLALWGIAGLAGLYALKRRRIKAA
jgi:hypothetical protein